MSEEFAEYLTEPFDSILAEDYRLRMEEALPNVNSHLLDDLSIEFAQMAQKSQDEMRELED